MTGQHYLGLRKNIYTAGKKIGQGGEGAVYEINEDSTKVLKIYIEVLSEDKREKLTFMSTLASEELVTFAAWPLDVVKNKEGQICGFVMRKLQSYVALHNLFSPLDRKKLFPDKGYNFLVHVARNLAVAFHKIHQLGIAIGDVNEANILVNASGTIAFIDCDSFQIKNGSKYHFCEVGIPRYTPPELLIRGSFENVIRTADTDNFSLSTLIFQLLFLGRAPFTGINLTNTDIDEEAAIKSREFAYSLKRNNKRLLPAKNSLDIRMMTHGVNTLFHAAFEGTSVRPSAAMWVNEIGMLAKQIVQCRKVKLHFYPTTIDYCPWCRFQEKSNIMYFLDDPYLENMPSLQDIEQFVNGFKIERIELKKLSKEYLRNGVVADKIDRKFYRLKNINAIVSSAIILVALVLWAKNGFAPFFWGVLLVVVVNMLSPTTKILKEEIASRQKKFDTLKESHNSLLKQYNHLPEMKRYDQTVSKLGGLVKSFRELPMEFNKEKKKIEEKHYQQKLTAFLRQYDIRDHVIPNFGAAKKRLIFSNGIRTAADINKLHRVKITGIGPSNTQILLIWQRRLTIDFVYNPDKLIIASEIKQVIASLTQKRQRLESDIRNEYKSASILKSSILSNAKGLEKQYDDIGEKLYKAELDLIAFKRFLGKSYRL